VSGRREVPADLRVDWPRCAGRGLCHELLPEAIDLDPWGYPLVTAPVDRRLRRAAREAVRSCPLQALRLVDRPAPPEISRRTLR
jgi:ferredoxin